MSTTVPSVDVSSSLDDDAIYSTKRAEKLLKKAKPILDEKQKLKNRLAALYNLIDAVSPVPATIGVPNVGISANNQISGDGLPQPSDSYVDQLVLQRFFKDNFIPIFSVLTESLNNHVEKKRSSEKGQGKDTSDFLRIAIILRKLIGFIPDKIESGWESQRFPLNLTVFDSSPTPLPSDLARSDCLGDDGIPDYQQPNDTEKHNTYETSKIIQSSEIDTVASSTEPDSIEILQEILSNLVMMATQSCSISQGSNRLSTQNCDNTDWRTLLKTVNMSESAVDKLVLNRTAFQALLVHWHCFKHCYFPKLFPSIYSKFWAISGEELEAVEKLSPVNAFLRRYIRYVQLLYLDKKDYVENVEQQFCIWIRSGTRSDAFWNMLKESLSKCNRWNQMYVQYIRIVTKLTKVISIRIFGIDSDQFMKEDMDTKTSQRLRTASISASRTRNSASSSPSSNKFKVQTPLAELTETTISPAKLHSEVTISLLNHKKEMESMKNDTASVESSESGILNHNQWSKQESFGKKQDGHNLKILQKDQCKAIILKLLSVWFMFQRHLRSHLKGLSSGDRRILMAIMNNSTKFFFVPGSKDLGEMSEKSRESSIRILLSIFTLPDWKRVDTGKDNFPYLPNGLKTRISVANSSIKAADYYNNFNDQQGLQVLIKDMLLSFVKLEKETRNSHLIHSVLIWAIGSISFEEMLSSLSDAVHSAIESLAFFAKESMLLDCVLDLQLIARVIESLVSATLVQLRSHIKTAPKCKALTNSYFITFPVQDTIVSDLLYCMLHWLMIPSTDILSNSNIATIVFETLELVLKESECEVEEEPDMGNTLERQRSHKIDDIVSGSTGKLATAGYKLETSKASFSDVDEELNQLKETVENITSHLLQFYNSFAPPFGPTILTSQILEQGLVEEKSSEKIVYIAANEIAVIGCTDVKNVCMNQAAYGFMNRIVSRDASGRHVWENQMFYEALVETISLRRKEINSVSWFQQSLDLEGIEVLLSETPISTILSDLYLFDKEDKLDNLLLRIGTEFQECLFDSESPLNAPNSVLTITQEDVSQIVESAEILDGEVVNSVSNCRLYLSHLGLFNFDSSKEGNYSPVSKSSSLSRDIRGIDKKYGREIIKVALIYVAPGQEDETNILRNHDASLEYREFVTSLGWEVWRILKKCLEFNIHFKVDISKHMGYIGGLERNQTAGISTLYYCDHSIEMVFHDALKMPVDAHDPKQVKKTDQSKKRHIGNDHVHIVWNEHFRDYRKHTIGGDFGNAQIIITPTMNDLYHISISKDAKVDYFGPLQSHALIQKTTLGPLVRNTAINAFRGSVFPGYKKKLNSHHPYSQRSTDINTLSSRHKTVNHTFEIFWVYSMNKNLPIVNQLAVILQ
ncbi:hypothetical protein BCR33DRAFT_734729 [Rhizoclosmatium globosum]|uniref:Rap-GAP domain-containing protein n=1 Tax=Rhizoclosmatium globosum TaxID=329046 RepID=A0A1Y2CSR5_9FUNG|nr:hypothetical protein BCR33DRAFT_734729 [Rhizoclosmatium globosum]|eukprot:ORY49997.1 hypothetical protein BCR33DRAFT_734729 [Rhizoclosmatium globosum]